MSGETKQTIGRILVAVILAVAIIVHGWFYFQANRFDKISNFIYLDKLTKQAIRVEYVGRE